MIVLSGRWIPWGSESPSSMTPNLTNYIPTVNIVNVDTDLELVVTEYHMYLNVFPVGRCLNLLKSLVYK